MILKIISKKESPFKGDDQEFHDYAWYTAEKENGLVVRFGSPDMSHEKGQVKEIALEEREQTNGKKGLYELVLRDD